MSFKFGDFEYLCSQASITFCAALGQGDPPCYSRNIDLGGFLLFQPAVLVIDIAALVMTVTMIYNIRRKYTAVGRKEIVLFFYLYAVDVLLELLLMPNIISIGSSLYSYIAAIQAASICCTFWVLLLNGFVGFQWAEDGTRWSLWSLRISTLIVGTLAFTISILTFNDAFGTQIVFFIILYMFNFAFLLIYVVLQFVLVINTLEDLWPLGDIVLGILFFIAAQVILLFVSNPLCEMTVHYMDGMFFASLFTLLSVMMVYKYWDSITKEDLEFSLGGPPPLSYNSAIALSNPFSHPSSKDFDKSNMESLETVGKE